MAPRYRLNTATFIAPAKYEAGTIIEYNGPPGPHMEPVNDEAKAALETYYKEHPGARLNPVEDLPMTTGAVMIAPPNPQPAGVALGVLGDPGKAVRVEDLVIRHAGTAGGAVVTPDADGFGSKAPTSDKPLVNDTPTGSFTQTTGDAMNPGAKDSDVEQKKAADTANEKATPSTDNKQPAAKPDEKKAS